MNALSSKCFRPQLESLSDRIVPSMVTTVPKLDPKAQFVADAQTIYGHAIQGQLTAADYQTLNADAQAIAAQYNTAITQLITYYNSLDQATKTAVTEEVLQLIDDLQTASQYIGQAAYNLELSLYNYDLGVIAQDPNFAKVDFAQASLDLGTTIQYYTSPFIAEADQLVQVCATFPTSQPATTGVFDPDNDGDDDNGEVGY